MFSVQRKLNNLAETNNIIVLTYWLQFYDGQLVPDIVQKAPCNIVQCSCVAVVKWKTSVMKVRNCKFNNRCIVESNVIFTSTYFRRCTYKLNLRKSIFLSVLLSCASVKFHEREFTQLKTITCFTGALQAGEGRSEARALLRIGAQASHGVLQLRVGVLVRPIHRGFPVSRLQGR